MEVILLLNAGSNNILKTALVSDVRDSESKSEKRIAKLNYINTSLSIKK